MQTDRRVLIIEDCDDSREMMRMLLELHGHTVFQANNGERGIELALSTIPHVALIDVGLPGLDGFEVARRIRSSAEGKTIYLVALTGYGQPEDRQRAGEAGFDEHVVKPLDPGRLAALLARQR